MLTESSPEADAEASVVPFTTVVSEPGETVGDVVMEE